jgi:predicted metal-dependent phosphoesterase TrpH
MIDLHVHTTASDGTLSPAAVVRLAADRGVTAVAVTDHDTVAGLAEAMEESTRSHVEVVPGVELSAEWDRGILHILGFFVDRTDPDLLRTLDYLKRGREERTVKILSKLAGLGIEIPPEDVAAESGCGVPGRPHIARVMVRTGFVAEMQEAFDRYLRRGAPAYAKKPKLDAVEALKTITHAGGLPVMAHPYSVLSGDSEGLGEVVRRLKEHGLQGLEAYYPEHTPAQTQTYLGLADKYHLVATGGTDFHGANKPGIQLGRIPEQGPLPYRLLVNLKRRRMALISSRESDAESSGADAETAS